jgi:hypothetical protein
VAKRAKIQRKGNRPVYDKHGDEVINEDKYDNDEDHLPVTNASHSVSTREAEREAFIDAKAAELIKKHHQEFMKKVFLLRVISASLPLTTASAMIKMCRPCHKPIIPCTVLWYFWRARLRSDATRVKRPDHRVRSEVVSSPHHLNMRWQIHHIITTSSP